VCHLASKDDVAPVPVSGQPQEDGPASPLAALLATGVHTIAYLTATGLIAWVVYSELGLAVLQKTWLNLNLVWATNSWTRVSLVCRCSLLSLSFDLESPPGSGPARLCRSQGSWPCKSFRRGQDNQRDAYDYQGRNITEQMGMLVGTP